MKKVVITGIVLPILLFCVACDKDPSTTPEGPKGELPRELNASEMKIIAADQSFSYDIFRRTVAYDTEEENLMISPLSISTALAMTLNGAKGQTFEDMQASLYLHGMSMDEINDAFQSLVKLLLTADPEVKIKIANSVWYKEGLPVEEDFVQRLKNKYEAEITGLDFSDPGAKDIINKWVAENTEGLIKTIIDEIPGNMIMYLINALYFKGNWLTQFDKDDTHKADFVLESGERVQVDMMSQKSRFAMYADDDVRLVQLPYGDSLFTMSVLMPGDPKMPIDQFVAEKVTQANLATWRSKLRVYGDMDLKLPKFELEYELKYNDILKAMGMEIAFDGPADFTGIAPLDLLIDEVKHKTFIRVDEEGTEAAAVTSVGIVETSLPPSVVINRPFVFIIYEQVSGANLFMGKVKKL
ncbi:serpin family protein [Sinomicrobium weinanense]|uniref:Serpin family protein n=1 Tax=Sinomicrobium weinanense TaxID=2842200 RepID=A0A926JUG6_9FLAO|nr:serpin family protein [Sinomicrobium weinanense]MBC9797463.1 serpin family protein [Sinomicrobium weinanense]MBU3124455.1 serpin family protein [Sinomicrobium weinanense]